MGKEEQGFASKPPETGGFSFDAYPLDKLEWRDSGNGAPSVVLLHGWAGNAESLAVIGRKLEAHRRVAAISLPGFGASPEPDLAWGSREYAELVRRWMLERGLAGADLISHSFGARPAICLAATNPEMVGRLVFMGAAGLRAPRSAEVKLKIAMSKLLRMTANLVGGTLAERARAKREKLGSTDWQAASPQMRGVLGRVLAEDLSDECRKISAQTLLVWGENDTATPLAIGERMQKLIAKSNLKVFQGAGHYVFLDKPGETLSEIWRHLDLPAAW